jgi:S1-C subfamily serine protease
MMTAVKRYLLASGAVISVVCLTPQARATPTHLPPLPANDGAQAAGEPADPAPAANPTPQELYERVRRGVVAIQARGSGVPSALGTVLSGDGRILTSWSGLSGAQQADVRYADGTTVHAKVERTDRNLDLALLTPDPVHSKEGLPASEADPAGLDIRAMLPGHGAFLGPALATLHGPAEAHARGGEPLFQMWNVDVQGAPVAGAPLLDPAGAVVAVLVRGCRGAASPEAAVKVCQPVVLGAPVAAIRTFLSPLTSTLSGPSAPPAAPAPPVEAPPAPVRPAAPVLGVRVEPQVSGAVHGVRVAAVAPGGPAEAAGLKPSADVIVAVDGQPIASGEALGSAISKHAPGDPVKLLVYGAGTFREVTVTLQGQGAR